MSFLEELDNAAGGATSVWHQFIVAHDPRGDHWYVFVEGKLDVPFYVSAVQRFVRSTSEVVELRCAGKESVKLARAQVRETHPRCDRCLFFVDKDLDGIINPQASYHSDMYCTQGYSIENDLVTGEAVEVVWNQIWNLPSSDPRRAVVLERYHTALRRFYLVMCPVMAWVVLARKEGGRPNLNNVSLSEVVLFSDGIPRLAPSAFGAIRRQTSCDFRPGLKEWLNQARELRRRDAKNYVRGKFELWFFCKFLSFVVQTLRASGLRPDGSIQCAPESLARALIGKVRLPLSLGEFLSNAVSRAHEEHCTGGV